MIGKSLAVKTIEVSNKGEFICSSTSQKIDDEIMDYSRFKFGGIPAINTLSYNTAICFIEELESGGGLREMFEKAKNGGEFIYIQSPGVRNVASSSNYLMQSVASIVNVWLVNNGYPTMIKKPITRLASGIANYAELSAEERNKRIKTTVSLYPLSDYSDYPINVIFIDDVQVTGCTRKRSEYSSIQGGALSFHSIFAYQVKSESAEKDASIENLMNQFAVKGHLDDEVTQILNHQDYQPVQRMLRLLLHPRNRGDLPDYMRSEISETISLRLYLAALSNDYHSIKHDGELLYRPSINILHDILKDKRLVGELGLPCIYS